MEVISASIAILSTTEAIFYHYFALTYTYFCGKSVAIMENLWQKPSYSLSFILGKPNRYNTRKIYLRYVSGDDDWLLYDETIRIENYQFVSNSIKAPIKNHPDEKRLNSILNNYRITVENRITSATRKISKEYLEGNVSSSDRIVDFISEFVVSKMEDVKNYEIESVRGAKRKKPTHSKGRLAHYNVIKNDIDSFNKKATFKDISLDWINGFELKLLEGDIGGQTLNSKMKLLISVFSKAEKLNMIHKDQYKAYKLPDFENGIPEHLDESEMTNWEKVASQLGNEVIQTSIYYFLLACRAGYRISDLYAFNYNERVRDGIIILRAKKNGRIVSIPIYPELKRVLAYCANHKLKVSEITMRKHIRSFASMLGCSTRKITPHTGRHSFGMRMTIMGFNIDEVAELMGDSINVARRYARIVNSQLHKKIRDTYGE